MVVPHPETSPTRLRLDTKTRASIFDASECELLWARVIEQAERDKDDYFFWEGAFLHIAHLLGMDASNAYKGLIERGAIQPLETWEEAKRSGRNIRRRWSAQPIYEGREYRSFTNCTLEEWERWVATWDRETPWDEWINSEEAKTMDRQGRYSLFAGRYIVGWNARKGINGHKV